MPTIKCDPQSLIEAAKCYCRVPEGMQLEVMIYLLDQISGLNLTPQQLIDAAKCFRRIPKGMQDEVITYLLCQIANGAGVACDALSGAGSPVGAATPQFIGQLYHDTVADAYYRSTGLTSADWVSIGGSSTAVVMSAVFSGGLSLSTDSVTTSLTFPNLTTINGSAGLYVSDFSALTLLSLPSLTALSLDGFEVDNDGGPNPFLVTISAPLLVTVPGSVQCSNNPMLANIDWSSWVPTEGSTINFSGDALTAASVELILRRCVLAGVTTCTIQLTGGTNAGLLSLSAQGQSDYATLFTAGNTITLNP